MKWERRTFPVPAMAQTKYAMRLTLPNNGGRITRYLMVSDEMMHIGKAEAENYAWNVLRREIVRAIEDTETNPELNIFDTPEPGLLPVGSHKNVKYPYTDDLHNDYLAFKAKIDDYLKTPVSKKAKVSKPDTTYTDNATSEFEGVTDLDPELWKGSDANGFT